MEISSKLKGRFCRDCGIPIKLYKEPYFTERLELCDPYYGSLAKYEVFKKSLEAYEIEGQFIDDYESVYGAAIKHIKDSEGYKRFVAEDMNKFIRHYTAFPTKDIYRSYNDNGVFISIDMKKANFSAMHYYDASIFTVDGKESNCWEDFISCFTSNEHVINSKQIRQAVMGNCIPKRQITYEKYLMDSLFDDISSIISLDNVAFFSNDEIVLRMSECSIEDAKFYHDRLTTVCKDKAFPLKVTLFRLHEIKGCTGFYKEFLDESNNSPELKCIDSYTMPLVLRKLRGEEITENDKVFYHDGYLAKLLEVPEISV